MRPAYDKIGQTIEPGAYVVYGHALGRCAGLRVGRILQITPKGQKHHFTVQGIDDDWEDRVAKLTRKGTLQFAERILVVDPQTLPDYYRALLRDCPITRTEP